MRQEPPSRHATATPFLLRARAATRSTDRAQTLTALAVNSTTSLVAGSDPRGPDRHVRPAPRPPGPGPRRHRPAGQRLLRPRQPAEHRGARGHLLPLPEAGHRAGRERHRRAGADHWPVPRARRRGLGPGECGARGDARPPGGPRRDLDRGRAAGLDRRPRGHRGSRRPRRSPGLGPRQPGRPRGRHPRRRPHPARPLAGHPPRRPRCGLDRDRVGRGRRSRRRSASTAWPAATLSCARCAASRGPSWSAPAG